jgi:hypothetical protein
VSYQYKRFVEDKRTIMSSSSFFKVVTDSEVTKVIQINQGKQVFKMQIQMFLVDLHFQDGTVGCARLFLYYEFENGWFVWSLSKLDEDDIETISSIQDQMIFGETIINNLLKKAYFYVSNAKMIRFSLMGPTNIYFKEFTQRYSTFTQGRQIVLDYLENRLDSLWNNLEKGRYLNWSKEILIGEAVDRRFFYRPTGRKGRNIFGEFVGAKITEVTYHNSLWQIQLESTENRQTTLILDDHFKLLNVLGDGAKGQDY